MWYRDLADYTSDPNVSGSFSVARGSTQRNIWAQEFNLCRCTARGWVGWQVGGRGARWVGGCVGEWVGGGFTGSGLCAVCVVCVVYDARVVYVHALLVSYVHVLECWGVELFERQPSILSSGQANMLRNDPAVFPPRL